MIVWLMLAIIASALAAYAARKWQFDAAEIVVAVAIAEFAAALFAIVINGMAVVHGG